MGKCTTLNATEEQIAAMLAYMGFGNHYYVDYGTGADRNNDGTTWDKAWRTLSYAISQVTTNNNDVIHINGNSTVVETAMVTLSKSRVHIVGHNGALGHYGHGAKVSVGITTAATDIATFKNTGVRNTVTGVKFINENTVAEGLYCVAEAGEFARYHNCTMYKSTDLDDAGASELLINGDSSMLYNFTIGSLANITGNIRANILLTNVLNQCRDGYFENCKLWAKADDTDKVFVYGGAATAVERLLEFKECTFANNTLAAGVPAHAVGASASQTNGSILLNNCCYSNVTKPAEAARNIWVQGSVPTVATSGLAVTE